MKSFGMSWGGTLNIATRFLAALQRPDLEVISVMGGLTRGSDLNSFEITTRLADLLGAQHSYFTAPLYAGSAESRDTIMQLDVFREVLEKIRGVDAMAMAAGDLDVTVFQDAAGQGQGSIDAALKLARGEAVDQKVYIPFQLVTPANMADFQTKN